jgi:PPOX class probable F420-dependent enzyme
MPHGDLPHELLDLLRGARTATLATIRPDGRPRLVPVCFVVADAAGQRGGLVVHSPIDEKPKRSADPYHLARVADILERPRVELLVDRWDEDWRRLAWVRLDGTASLLAPDEAPAERAAAIERLRAKYPQYASQRLDDRPLLRIAVAAPSWWSAEG